MYTEEIEWYYVRRNSTIDEVQQFEGQNSTIPGIVYPRFKLNKSEQI